MVDNGLVLARVLNEDAAKLFRRFRFALVFENRLSPRREAGRGRAVETHDRERYVTEKIMNAFLAGARSSKSYKHGRIALLVTPACDVDTGSSHLLGLSFRELLVMLCHDGMLGMHAS